MNKKVSLRSLRPTTTPRSSKVEVQIVVLNHLGKALRRLVSKSSRFPTHDDIRAARILIQTARGELLGYYEGPLNRRRLIPPNRMPPIRK
jgi:hypothetical protein